MRAFEKLRPMHRAGALTPRWRTAFRRASPCLGISLLLLLLGTLTDAAQTSQSLPTTKRQAGILYETWHCRPAAAMAKVAALNLTQLTTERVLRSDGKHTLNDVYRPQGLGPFASSREIFNVEPAELGFYCLCSSRTGNDGLPDCPMRDKVARRHAEMLTKAGFDYIALDITNWPQVNPATDLQVLRPLENLLDAWVTLRAEGFPTPNIAVWCQSPVASYPDGHQTTWSWLLDNVYNNETRAKLLWSRVAGSGKSTFFLPATGAYNSTVAALIQSNGGRNNIDIVKMWALGSVGKGSTTWGFFAPCTTAEGRFTTSMVEDGLLGDCNQYVAMAPSPAGVVEEVSASAGYMLSQGALPFASPGHLRGLTLQRTFKKVLEVGAPHLFMSSFNEHIGGRQKSVFNSAIAFNMGLPNDPQRDLIWVDTYGAEFSRDVEPTVEGGSRIWEVTVSCVQLYKQALKCSDAEAADTACCTTSDKEVYANAWSLARTDGQDALITNSPMERKELLGTGNWSEICHAIAGPAVFCVDTHIADGRNGPFMLYNTPAADMSVLPGAKLVPLHRCLTNHTKEGCHFLSSDAGCEGLGQRELLVGYMSTQRGWETLRALRRCGGVGGTNYSHALDLECEGAPGVFLGFVR